MLVWVYPEKKHEPLGAERWCVVWYELKEGARRKLDADPDYEWDPSFDVETHRDPYPNAAAARKAARKRVKTTDPLFGQVEVQRQRVDWYVEEDRVAEWSDVGDVEYVE